MSDVKPSEEPGAQQDVAARSDGCTIAEPEASPAPDAPHRSMKLVLTLQPANGGVFGAAVAIGTGGCDPLLHYVEVEGLPAALDLLPRLVSEAESRWRVQPRYPSARPSNRARETATAKRKGGTPSPTESPLESPQDGQLGGEPHSNPEPKAQLSLFS